MSDMVEIPLDRAQAFGALLAAAMEWRDGLIPKTSTGTAPSTVKLLHALTAFDRPPCDHPRSWRVYRSQAQDADEVCARCGTAVVAGLTPRWPDDGSDAPSTTGRESDAPAT
jgi:hypothetical protein